MERNDETTPERDAADASAERATHKHPAGPQTPDSGFAEGQDREPDSPAEELEPDFARGQHGDDLPDEGPAGNFAEGQEVAPDTTDKRVERRFSEGQERSPTSE